MPWIINKSADKKTAELLIYDQIGADWFGEGVTAKQFVKDLRALGKIDRLDVRINSPGGNVFDGLAIYNALKSSKYTVDVYIDGLAASMASVIAMAGDRIAIADNALMMVHNPATMVYGDSKEIRKAADLLDTVKNQLVASYADQTGHDEAYISGLMDATTWMDAEEAFERGFVTEIVEDAVPAMAASWQAEDLPNGFAVPERFQDQFTSITSNERATMSQEPEVKEAPAAEPVKVYATVEQLTALPGADDAFVIASLTAKRTIDEAKDALHAQVFAKLVELQAATAAPVVKDKAEGVEPISGTKSALAHEEAPFGGEPAKFYAQQLAQRMSDGVTNAFQASRNVYKDYPGLRDAF